MCTAISFSRPDKIEPFLIDYLKKIKEHGSRYSIYTENEIQNIFTLFDLKNEGFITKQQCKEGNFS